MDETLELIAKHVKRISGATPMAARFAGLSVLYASGTDPDESRLSNIELEKLLGRLKDNSMNGWKPIDIARRSKAAN